MRSLVRHGLLVVAAVALTGCADLAAPRATPAMDAARLAAVLDRAAQSRPLVAARTLLEVIAPGADLAGMPAGRTVSTMSRLTDRAGEAARTLASLLRPELLGVVFEYDAARQGYVASDRAGAPADGIRFILYATELDGTPRVSEEIGYADLVNRVLADTAAVGVRLDVVLGTVTRLRYGVAMSRAPAAPRVQVDGFVLDEQDDSLFVQLDATPIDGPSPASRLDATVRVPAADVEVHATLVRGATATDDQSLDLVVLAFPNEVVHDWRVRDGRLTAAVLVNGVLVARATGDPAGPELRAPDGRPLTLDERPFAQSLFALAQEMVTLVDGLWAPALPLLDFAVRLGG